MNQMKFGLFICQQNIRRYSSLRAAIQLPEAKIRDYCRLLLFGRSARHIFDDTARWRFGFQYSSASMTVSTRVVTSGSAASGEPCSRSRA